jgi:hypothetical protein
MRRDSDWMSGKISVSSLLELKADADGVHVGAAGIKLHLKFPPELVLKMFGASTQAGASSSKT